MCSGCVWNLCARKTGELRLSCIQPCSCGKHCADYRRGSVDIILPLCGYTRKLQQGGKVSEQVWKKRSIRGKLRLDQEAHCKLRPTETSLIQHETLYLRWMKWIIMTGHESIPETVEAFKDCIFRSLDHLCSTVVPKLGVVAPTRNHKVIINGVKLTYTMLIFQTLPLYHLSDSSIICLIFMRK